MCIDTAHLFAENIDIDEMIKQKIKPTIIHLNGNKLSKGSFRDIHVDIMSKEDKIWNTELLKKFIKRYK